MFFINFKLDSVLMTTCVEDEDDDDDPVDEEDLLFVETSRQG